MAMKKKGYAKGGAMKKKGYAKGGAMKKPIAMKKGSKLRMVEKDGKKVPFFAADGIGKMQAGGAVRPKKRPASMVKPKPRPGSKNGITKETLVGSMTKADVEKAINRGKNPKKKPRPMAPSKPRSTRSTDKDMAVSKQAAQSKKAPVRKKGDRAGVTAKKMGGGMMKKKGMAKGGVVKKGVGGTIKKKTPKPAANYSQVGKYIPKGSQDDKRPAGKAFRPATKAEVEKMRADKRRAERKKSGQLDQAKKKARKTAVKAMGGGMMKKKGMAKGGAMKKKGYAKGGVVKKMRGGMMKKKGYAKGGSVARGRGAARPQRFTRNG